MCSDVLFDVLFDLLMKMFDQSLAGNLNFSWYDSLVFANSARFYTALLPQILSFPSYCNKVQYFLLTFPPAPLDLK